MNPKVIDDIISDLKVHQGYLVITRVNKHSCMGMDIEITKEKKIKIYMKEHLEEVIEKFG